MYTKFGNWLGLTTMKNRKSWVVSGNFKSIWDKNGRNGKRVMFGTAKIYITCLSIGRMFSILK